MTKHNPLLIHAISLRTDLSMFALAVLLIGSLISVSIEIGISRTTIPSLDFMPLTQLIRWIPFRTEFDKLSSVPPSGSWGKCCWGPFRPCSWTEISSSVCLFPWPILTVGPWPNCLNLNVNIAPQNVISGIRLTLMWHFEIQYAMCQFRVFKTARVMSWMLWGSCPTTYKTLLLWPFHPFCISHLSS